MRKIPPFAKIITVIGGDYSHHRMFYLIGEINVNEADDMDTYQTSTVRKDRDKYSIIRIQEVKRSTFCELISLVSIET